LSTDHRAAFAGRPGETDSLRPESLRTNQDHLRTDHKGKYLTGHTEIEPLRLQQSREVA